MPLHSQLFPQWRNHVVASFHRTSCFLGVLDLTSVSITCTCLDGEFGRALFVWDKAFLRVAEFEKGVSKDGGGCCDRFPADFLALASFWHWCSHSSWVWTSLEAAFFLLLAAAFLSQSFFCSSTFEGSFSFAWYFLEHSVALIVKPVDYSSCAQQRCASKCSQASQLSVRFDLHLMSPCFYDFLPHGI